MVAPSRTALRPLVLAAQLPAPGRLSLQHLGPCLLFFSLFFHQNLSTDASASALLCTLSPFSIPKHCLFFCYSQWVGARFMTSFVCHRDVSHKGLGQERMAVSRCQSPHCLGCVMEVRGQQGVIINVTPAKRQGGWEATHRNLEGNSGS